jgi:pimeloyl-ACP methyl ester carboxylesterase
MAHLNIERAHVVGHSYGGNIALQLAIDSPDRVHSLSLMEGGLLFEAIFPKTIMEKIGQEMMRTTQIYHSGDKSGALETYLKFVIGSEVRATLDRVLPGAFEQAIKDIDTFFEIELPALRSWSPSPVQTRSIKKPILIVLGENTLFTDAAKEAESKISAEWFPQAERVWIPKATHFSQLSNLQGLSEALGGFFAKHPISA